MNPFTVTLVLGFTVVSLVLIFMRVQFMKVLAALLIGSQFICVYDIILRQPAQIAWLCNVSVFMNIFLIFKFNQKIFDVFFFYTWLGCFYICMMPINPYSMMIKDLPLVWVAYWIKHLAPLLFTLYFFYVEKRKLSWWGLYRGVFAFFAYCFCLYFYNILLNQNVLYLNHPAPFMVPLGKYYYWIIVQFGYVWVSLLYSIVVICKRVKSKNEYLPKDRIQDLEVEEV